MSKRKSGPKFVRRPLKVYINEDTNLAFEDVAREQDFDPYNGDRGYKVLALSRGEWDVLIGVQEGDGREFFCGDAELGNFSYIIRTGLKLSQKQRQEIYEQVLNYIQLNIRSGLAITFADRQCPINSRTLSLWEMGQMLPCTQSPIYRNPNSRNRVRMYIYVPE